MLNHPSFEMASVAHSLGFHDIMMNILMKLPLEKLKSLFLYGNCDKLGTRLIFSKMDVNIICERIKKRRNECVPLAKKLTLNLEDIFKELEEPLIDLNQKWHKSDVSLQTKSSEGRVLYSNKAACVSEHFKKLFYSNADAISENEAVIHIDAEYATVKQILSIVHHCKANFHRSDYTLIQPVLIYDMYVTASEDQLNIPMIKKFCYQNLREQKNSVTYDVAAKLGLDDLKVHLVLNMDRSNLWAWAQDKSEALSYLIDGKEVVISTGDSSEQIFSAEDVFRVIRFM